ncbi:phage terminase small subunit P27 family [Pseudomonadota bacterium]
MTPNKLMTPAGKKLFRQTVKTLESMGVELQVGDADLIENYVNSIAMIRRCVVDIQTNGITLVGANGSPLKNPVCTVLKEAQKTMFDCSDRLGLSPRARKVLAVQAQTSDPLAELMGK